ncbi:uncharacterized protein LOC107963974 isoform X2 [Apis mellifera]|uniref:Uncharacterized protein LOC107963974 isoform X2 n=1 Tax=Apis mellifera TaxID=7460 RepID=A0A7M7IHI2_APIME|nr:uncharacterized protein LOC107963974 isoform X2 [Apis mellifera]|eukprot:XP_016769675.1 uncharacterized protein LOC107963974 isoform X2 [Apis mellifera]
MRLLFRAILCLTLVTAAQLVTRPARSLSFRKGSSFFYRVNFKIAMFPYTTIFSHVAGFKLVWLLPTGAEITRFVRSVDDVHQAAEIVYESHGFDGRSCLLKNICQAMEYVSQRDGVIAKILKLLAGSYNGTTGNPVYCDVHVRRCPLDLIGVDYFTGQ